MKRTGEKVGVRALARETGYSTATVSRVLNGGKSVSAETKARVEAAIQRLNYIPNPAARALSTRRTRMIGALIPTIEHSIFARFIASLEAALANADYSLVIATNATSPEAETERAIELMNIGVEALVVSGATHNERLRALAETNGTPIVCTSIYDPVCDLPTIGYDNFKLGSDAIDYLFGFGHRQIAILHGDATDNDRTSLRLEGIRSAARGHGIDLSCFESALSVHGGAASASHALSAKVRPSALLCLSDVLALGALFEAPRQRVSVPDDVSIMGFDNLEWSETSEPALTTIDLPVVSMGNTAAEAILGFLNDGVAIEHIRLPARVIERGTVVNRRAKT